MQLEISFKQIQDQIPTMGNFPIVKGEEAEKCIWIQYKSVGHTLFTYVCIYIRTHTDTHPLFLLLAAPITSSFPASFFPSHSTFSFFFIYFIYALSFSTIVIQSIYNIFLFSLLFLQQPSEEGQFENSPRSSSEHHGKVEVKTWVFQNLI